MKQTVIQGSQRPSRIARPARVEPPPAVPRRLDETITPGEPHRAPDLPVPKTRPVTALLVGGVGLIVGRLVAACRVAARRLEWMERRCYECAARLEPQDPPPPVAPDD